MTARKAAVKDEPETPVQVVEEPAAELADPGQSIDVEDVKTVDPEKHKNWVTLFDGTQGWVKREKGDSVLVVPSLAGFEAEPRWVHRDNVHSTFTRD